MPGDDVALGAAVFDPQVREMEGPDQVAEFEDGFQINVHADLFTVLFRFMHGKVEDARSLRPACQGVFLVSGEASYPEALGVNGAVLSIPVNQVEDGVVILLDDGDIERVFSGEEFVLNAHDFQHACIGPRSGRRPAWSTCTRDFPS